jgi:DNA-binding beta-propeller fold protein YncE
MRRRIASAIGLSALVVATLFAPTGPPVAADDDGDDRWHEVWAIDQSDTAPDGGGTLYIYKGSKLSGRRAASARPQVIDLGGDARTLCLAQTGSAPRRPHMLMFNEDGSHAVIAFVATGHVLFMDAEDRTPVACIDVGAQAHAAFPSRDENYVVVANQNGKLLQRITTDYEDETFVLDPTATLNLATCVTPNGAPCEDPVLRPDNAPICPVIDSTSRFTFVTLRGGGLFVVDSTATPMAIVAEYDWAAVHPNGCGGLETRGKMYVNSGGGTAANPLEADLYAFPMAAFDTAPNPPNSPAPKLVFSHDSRGFVDSHGAVLTKHGRYLWVADRAANRIVVVDTRQDVVVNEIDLVGAASSDPAPDLMGISPGGNRVYISLRGPMPLTGNAPGVNNAVGATPGVGVVRVQRGGRAGQLQAIARISHVVAGVEQADPHGLGVLSQERDD